MQQNDALPPIQGIFFRDFKNSYIPQILKEVYIDTIYSQFLIGKRDLVIADWGANIGLTSYYFKDYAKQIYAVEPSKQHRESLETMLQYNKITNVKVCPYAISNENGKTKFFHNENTTMFSLNSLVNNKNEFEEVETVTPDMFFEREKIDHLDFLKFDLEGWESQVLTSDGFKKVAPLIKTIVLEYHTWTAMSFPTVVSLLRDFGFQVRRMPTQATVIAAERL